MDGWRTLDGRGFYGLDLIGRCARQVLGGPMTRVLPAESSVRAML